MINRMHDPAIRERVRISLLDIRPGEHPLDCLYRRMTTRFAKRHANAANPKVRENLKLSKRNKPRSTESKS